MKGPLKIQDKIRTALYTQKATLHFIGKSKLDDVSSREHHQESVDAVGSTVNRQNV